MKTPRRSSKVVTDTTPVTGIPVSDAKALFDAGDRVRAEAVAQRVLAPGSRADAAQQLVAWTVLAHTYFDEGRFADAEKAYAEMARLEALRG